MKKTIWIYPEVDGFEIIELPEEFKMQGNRYSK